MSNHNTAVRERRTNGFSPPYTAAQISTWIALPLLLLEFLFFVSPILPLIPSIICSVILVVFVALSAYYATMASIIDPMDVHLEKHLKKLNRKSDDEEDENNDDNGQATESPDSLKHCWICDTQVSEHAMHCKFCNKCIGHFDHHCMWLNTCVGQKNYPYFLRTMVYISLMLIVHCSIQIALIVDIFLDDDYERSRLRSVENWFPGVQSYIPVVSVLIVFAIFDLISLSLIGQLLYFHMGLRREGLTTYKYIVRETQRKRERTQNLARRHNQRMVAISKANDEGKSCYAVQIKYCGMLADSTGWDSCDPLSEKKKPNAKPTDDREQHNGNGEVGNGNSTDVSNEAISNTMSPPQLFQFQDKPIDD